MITPTPSPSDCVYSKIYESMKVGSVRELAAFMATHPLQFVITLRQTTPTDSPLTLTRKVYATGKLPAFYRGGWANGCRQFGKALYRAPLRAGVLESMRQTFPEMSAAKRGAIGSLIVASVDTIPYCFLQRWMVWTMTKEVDKRETFFSFLDFFRASQRSSTTLPLHRDLFKGMKITYLKQLSSWSSYLILSEYLRGNESRKETLGVIQQLYIGAMSGAFNGFCVMPFDRIKSMVQSHSYHHPATFKNMWQISRQIYKVEGVAGFYRAFWLRIILSIVSGLFTEAANEKVDAIWCKGPSKP